MKIGTQRERWHPVAVLDPERKPSRELNAPQVDNPYKKGLTVGNVPPAPSPPPEMTTSTLPRITLPAAQHCIDVLFPQQQQQQHTSINTILKRPIPNSYWATPLLLACEYPWCPGVAKQKIEALLAAGVRTFIDLTEVNELRAYGSYLSAQAEAMGLTDIEYHRFPIVDRSLPESIEYMRNILRVLKDNEQRGRITAVHCRGGIGRTGKSAFRP